MKDFRSMIAGKHLISIIAAIAFVLTSTDSFLAQQNKGRTRSTARNVDAAARERQRQVQNRSMAMEHIGDEEKVRRERALKLAQVREDFKRLQIVNNDMMRSIVDGGTLDYKLISDATEEINKCAKRLKMSLAFPDNEKDKKVRVKQVVSDGDQMRAMLIELDNSIMSFVTSLGVVDAKDMGKAGRSVNDVIDISEDIKKSAEKLQKTSKNSQ